MAYLVKMIAADKAKQLIYHRGLSLWLLPEIIKGVYDIFRRLSSKTRREFFYKAQSSLRGDERIFLRNSQPRIWALDEVLRPLLDKSMEKP